MSKFEPAKRKNSARLLELTLSVKMLLCTGDMVSLPAKPMIWNVWLPHQNDYREISSCSNFGDFSGQTHAGTLAYPETGKPELVHTLNGSGLAGWSTFAGDLENQSAS